MEVVSISVISLTISVIAQIVTVIVALVVMVMLMRKVEQTHHLINSRMDQMLTLARTVARAEGVVQGAQEENDRAAAEVEPIPVVVVNPVTVVNPVPVPVILVDADQPKKEKP